MNLRAIVLIASAAAVLALCANGAQAGDRHERGVYTSKAGHAKLRHHRKHARVYGYVARRGGYSYEPADVTNTYGQSRTLFGSTSVFRDPFTDRQTPSGPFDHGFFFDSGIAPRGGDSPYLH